MYLPVQSCFLIANYFCFKLAIVSRAPLVQQIHGFGFVLKWSFRYKHLISWQTDVQDCVEESYVTKKTSFNLRIKNY